MFHALAASVLHCACRIMPTPQCNVAFAPHAHNLSQQHQSHHTGGLCHKAQRCTCFSMRRSPSYPPLNMEQWQQESCTKAWQQCMLRLPAHAQI